jgi:hypothetical protein
MTQCQRTASLLASLRKYIETHQSNVSSAEEKRDSDPSRRNDASFVSCSVSTINSTTAFSGTCRLQNRAPRIQRRRRSCGRARNNCFALLLSIVTRSSPPSSDRYCCKAYCRCDHYVLRDVAIRTRISEAYTRTTFSATAQCSEQLIQQLAVEF